MPMWCDPLEELIADLERALPTAAPPFCDMPSHTDFASGLPELSWLMNRPRRCALPTILGSRECRRIGIDWPLPDNPRTQSRRLRRGTKSLVSP